MRQENQKAKEKQMKKYGGAKAGGDNRFSMQEAKKAAEQKKFFSQIGRGGEERMEDNFLYSTSEMTLNAINQIEKKIPNVIKKKGKAIVVCDTVLTEEQLNEKVELVRDPEPKQKKKGPDTQQWNKLTSGPKAPATGEDDMSDFTFVTKSKKVEDGFPAYDPAMFAM